jgi:hypothetical protein
MMLAVGFQLFARLSKWGMGAALLFFSYNPALRDDIGTRLA